MRILVLILIVAVFFLAGVLYGVNNNVSQSDTVEHVEQELDSVSERELAKDVSQEMSQPVQSLDTPAYKTASALQSIVQFISDIIVDILFQVSKLFY